MKDYRSALHRTKAEQKPLAVVVGKGATGWHQLSRSGLLPQESARLLAEKYVCLYVDASQADGRKLANSLAITNGHGLVISDATGNTMAFHHDGDLSRPDLTNYLRKYSDPNRDVRATETGAIQRASYYPAETRSPAPAAYYPPVSFGGFSGGGRC
jgi:hypothetical protein